MDINEKIRKFQKDCYQDYISSIQQQLKDFPKQYTYPDGNFIKPVLPVQTATNKIMIVGAFPSAKFEMRNNKLIPIADNLAPFGVEKYFDGRQIRIQESADSLHENYFEPLGIKTDDLWVTDIVKIYLYPEKHIKNCVELFPKKSFVNTHKMFEKIAELSFNWFKKELEICNPKLIITLGEVAAKVVSQDSKPQLDCVIRKLSYKDDSKIVHLVHPEFLRLKPNDSKCITMKKRFEDIRKEINALLK